MRRLLTAPGIFPVLISTAALLWLLWCFFPLSAISKSLITLMIMVVSCPMIWNSEKRRAQSSAPGKALPLLSAEHRGPVVLVCGDGMDELFPEQPVRNTSRGLWVRTGEVSELPVVIRKIQHQHPGLIGQLSVMYCCLPDQHQDEAVFRAGIKLLRQQLCQLTPLTGFPLPLVLNCRFSGPATPWIIVRDDKPFVCPEDESQVALAGWQQAADNIRVIPVLSQAFAFIRQILLDELTKADRLCPAVHPLAIALRTGAPAESEQSLWSQWLYRRVFLQLPAKAASGSAGEQFADPLLPLLAPYAAPVQGGKAARGVIFILLCCAIAALAFSVANNRRLIQQTGVDLARWYAIPVTHYAPKTQALNALKQDALLLERWHRQSEPLRYGLGLYPGQRLWLAVQQAIDTYVPPPPPPPPKVKPVPKIVRLDSLSLFDSGKSVLKTGSTKVLVNALVGIKAKPGWLIVVAGHTDNTGNPQLNQKLSQQRAQAVRDWMRDTGDVPESCFAVQGYGQGRPVASNDTPEGRALNRRVEISLVPQADACQVPGMEEKSPEPGDARS